MIQTARWQISASLVCRHFHSHQKFALIILLAHQRGFGEQCAIPFPRVFKPPRKFFLVLTLVDLYGKKYEGSTSAYKDDTWKYDRITLYVAYIEYFSSDFALQT